MTITAVQEPAIATVRSATSVTKAFASNVTAGNLVIIQGFRYDGGANTAFVAGDCTKSAGTATLGAITLDKQASANSTNPNQSGIWSAPVTGTGSLTMAIAGASGSYMSIVPGEYNGTDVTGSRLETSNSNSSTSATSPCTTGTATPAAEALYIACISVDTGSASLGPTVGNSFTQTSAVTDGSNDQCGVTGRRIATAVNTGGSWTISTTTLHGWAGALAVYKAAAAGTKAPPVFARSPRFFNRRRHV